MQNGRFHIVVVEDNPADLHMIQASIRGAGLDCSFATFAEGTTATWHVNEPTSTVPDLMIIDLNVPGVEGPSVLNGVRCNIRWSHVPVFIFTASQSPVDMARVKLLGSDRYLIKPMSLDGFLSFGKDVKEWLEAQHQQGAGSRADRG